jgi:hypothetical protein
MKPTYESVMKVVHLFAEMIPFFPNSMAALCAICEEIYSFVGTDQELAWFSVEYRRICGKKWEGQPLMRAVFCLKYQPADGIMPTVDAPGHTTEDLEARARLREMEENDLRPEAYKREALEAGEPLKAFPLPDVKRLN